ncbi:helix-turn-helix transcriptional regulator [Paenibacillus sediminis]|uniref:Transcriptional regulator with XRE-family HTH domain n=1 Tax=Paenibacillus sediminis TaxID=664909 RepID=A0ABS4H486_9BACL|nr:helix-turn-helix transcriptional regulator [Paenibacillus sediminis]MBP1937321.1 transcriptional regulator with XRE-family HTH domain [Paenibacillus sediminis]
MSGTIGTRVKRIRNLNEMTQVEFSSLLGISQGRLSEIEKDITKPSAETLIALRKRFKVDLNELLSDID